MPNRLYNQHPELLEARPGALQRSQWTDTWFFQADHLLEQFADPEVDRGPLVKDAGDWIGYGPGVAVEWERYTPEFIRLVRQADLDPAEAAAADRRGRNLINFRIAALQRAIDGQPAADDRDHLAEWPDAMNAVDDIETYVAAVLVPVPDGGSRTDRPPAQISVLLRNWGQIFAALNRGSEGSKWKNDESTRDCLLRLNQDFDGPIIPPARRGAHAKADEAKLLAWASTLGEQLRAREMATAERAEAERLTTAERHAYSRDGIVVPDIGGSVKLRKRRR